MEPGPLHRSSRRNSRGRPSGARVRLARPGASSARNPSLFLAGFVFIWVGIGAARPGPALAVKFMPTGDSITRGTGSTSGLGFRDLLYNSLNTVGVYDFVGSPDTVNGDPPYEGHFYGGQRIDAFRPGGAHDVDTPMDAQQPEVVAVHLGTNDLNSSPGPYGPWSNNHGLTTNVNASGKLGALVKYLLEWQDGTRAVFLNHVLLSRVIPIEGRDSDIEVYNREIVRMVLDFRNGAITGIPQPVYLADHYLRFLSNPNVFSEWMDDYLHPNDAGYDQMETVYFETTVEARDDLIPPAAPMDLAIGTIAGESVLLVWTNTGDDATLGNPSYADCRYATGSIDINNFKNLAQSGDYGLLGNGGELEGERIVNLQQSTFYNFAIKLMDNASQLSGMSNVVNATTFPNPDTWSDAFDRDMASPGPDWNADPEYVVNGELENTSTANTVDFLAIFNAVEDPVTCQFDWGATATQSGIDAAGFALRLDGSDPATADGYILYRNVEPGQPIVLKEIVDGGVTSPTIASATPQLPAPQAGDEFRVALSSDASGHHFALLINDELDGVVTDPARRHGNGTYYCGVITQGNLDNNVDNWLVETVTSNLPPAAFNLVSPPNGQLIPHLNPFLDWQSAQDPNGDPVTYSVFYSLDPGFPAELTTVVEDLTRSDYGVGVPVGGNKTYYWKVRAEDPAGASTTSTETRTFVTGNYQQLLDDFERVELGPEWTADPTYFIVNGELDCIGDSFHDLAIYNAVENPVTVEWKYSETSVQSEIGYAGCLIGMDAASTSGDGYFIFRNTQFQQRWSVWRVQNGELTGTLSIDQNGRNPIPAPGDLMRVVFIKNPTSHVFECYINGKFDARMTDTQRLEGTGPITYAGLLIGKNTDNNVEHFIVTAEGINRPPVPFALLEPDNAAVLSTFVPKLRWQPASDPNPGDLILYSVIYGLDPNFAGADTLPPTAATELEFTGKLAASQVYYWKVQAEDSGGEVATSNTDRSFSLAQVFTVLDDFNRTDLGPEWLGDLQVMEIVAEELANTSSVASFDFAVYAAQSNADKAEFTWSPSADPTGISRGGLALQLDVASGSPNGYFASIDPGTNISRLEVVENGSVSLLVASGQGLTGPPDPGDNFKVILTSDGAGHHFYYYVNHIFHSRLDDPDRRQGNGTNLFSGVALHGQSANEVDDFTMQSFGFGPPATPVPPAVPVLLVDFYPSVPNPFNPTFGDQPAAIAFDLSVQANVRLTIYDLSGRTVRELNDGPLGPGRHTITWNGRGQDGSEVGSGVYFARLRAGSWSGTQKLMLIK